MAKRTLEEIFGVTKKESIIEQPKKRSLEEIFSTTEKPNGIKPFKKQVDDRGNLEKASNLSEKFLSSVGEFAEGAGKGVISSIKGASSLGEKMLKGITKTILPKSLEPTTLQETETSAEKLIPKALTTAEGAFQKAGFLTEQIVEFLLPSSKIAKLERGLKLVPRMGVEAVVVGGQSALQRGAIDNETKTSAIIGAMFPLGGAILGKTKGILKPIGEKIQTTVIRPVERDLKDGFNIANVNKYNLGGSLKETAIKTHTKINKLVSELNESLKASEIKLSLNDVLNETKNELLTNKERAFGDIGSIKKVLDNVEGEIKEISPNGIVDLVQATNIKRGAGTKGSWAYNRPEPNASAIERVYTTFYNKIKTSIENASPFEIKKINTQISELIPISNAVLRRLPVEQRNNVISLTDSIGLFSAIFDPRALALIGANRLSKSGKFGSFLARLGTKKEPTTGMGKRIWGGNLDDLRDMPMGLSIKDVSKSSTLGANKILRGTKGLTDEAITNQLPNIKLKKDVPAKDIYGNKVEIPEGEKLTPYELKGNKVLLQDGQPYLVSKNQFQNIKGQSLSAEDKPFTPELEGLEETVKGLSKWQGDELIDNGKTIANVVKNEDGTWSYISDFSEGSSTFKTRREAMDYAEADTLGIYSGKETKYSRYQLLGGENYREVLVKAPEILKKGEYGTDVIDKSQTFRSSHWDEPNVISHLRINDRIYKGKKITFMEELQSDWAREGRSKGFTDTNAQKAFDDYSKSIKEKYGNNFLGKGSKEEVSKWDDLYKKSVGIPNHPLLKNWQELSIKRALKDAVDNDAAYFAWINGEQTSARYELATHVENVWWDKFKSWEGENLPDKSVILTPKDKAQNVTISLEKDGTIRSSSQGDWKGKKLDEVLGKGIADKIMSGESGNLSGEGLRFGGEWADNLYDKQVKNIVEDLTGGKVEMIDLKLPDSTGQQAIKLTPAIKNKIKGKAQILKTSGRKYE